LVWNLSARLGISLKVQCNISGLPLFANLPALAGFRFLIVEDEMVQAQRLGMLIAEMGGNIANISYGFEQARRAIDDTAFDCAILDVNLSGTLAFRLTDALDRKQIPFVFCTAYAEAIDVYPGASSVPRVDKPVRPSQMRDALLAVLP
jgi:CheY-like chemotaxis protein